MEYYFAEGNQQHGPHAMEELASLGVKPDTLVWYDGLPEWKPAGSLPELAPLFASPILNLAPAPVPVGAPPLTYQSSALAAGNQNGMAIASLVLGIMGLATLVCYLIGVVPALLAIIFGLIARKEIKQNGGQGWGMATAGLICGSISIGLVAITFTILVIVFALRR